MLDCSGLRRLAFYGPAHFHVGAVVLRFPAVDPQPQEAAQQRESERGQDVGQNTGNALRQAKAGKEGGDHCVRSCFMLAPMCCGGAEMRGLAIAKTLRPGAERVGL